MRNPLSGVTISDVVLLLDTGADITLLPRKAVEALAIPLIAGQGYELMGFDGSKSFEPAVTLDMILHEPYLLLMRMCSTGKVIG